MDRGEPQYIGLGDVEKMPDIGPIVTLTDRTSAILINWPEIIFVAGGLDCHFAL